MKPGTICRLFLALSLCCGTVLRAQPSKEEVRKAEYEQLKASVETKQYTFFAETATTMTGNLFHLTDPYPLKIIGDSLNVDLPYFGRAYVATLGDTNKGIRFATSKFTYLMKNGKKGQWLVTITPKDNRNASKMELSIGSDGYSTLQVTSTYRQLISYYGSVRSNTPTH